MPEARTPACSQLAGCRASGADQHGYVRGLEIDRIESDGDYEPGNCRYRTKKANIRDRDLAWSDELDAKLIGQASELGVSPYDLIRIVVEEYLGG